MYSGHINTPLQQPGLLGKICRPFPWPTSPQWAAGHDSRVLTRAGGPTAQFVFMAGVIGALEGRAFLRRWLTALLLKARRRGLAALTRRCVGEVDQMIVKTVEVVILTELPRQGVSASFTAFVFSI